MSIEQIGKGSFLITCPNPECPRQGKPWISTKISPQCPGCYTRRLDGRPDGRFTAQAHVPFEWVMVKEFSCGHAFEGRNKLRVCPRCTRAAAQPVRIPDFPDTPESREARRCVCPRPECPRQGKPWYHNRGKPRPTVCPTCRRVLPDNAVASFRWLRLKMFTACGHLVSVQEAKLTPGGCPRCASPSGPGVSLPVLGASLASSRKPKRSAASAAQPPAAPQEPRHAPTCRCGVCQMRRGKIELPKPHKVSPH